MEQVLRILGQTSGVDDISWGTLVKNFGVPGAFLAVALFALMKGWFITKREADEREKTNLAAIKLLQDQEEERRKNCEATVALMKEQRENDVKWWRERHQELKDEATMRLENMRTEKDMWRETALKATNLATAAAEKLPTANTSGGKS